jgi:hypothetical protein
MGKLKPLPSSLPSLSPDLFIIYTSLDNLNQRLFIKVFRYLWGVVLPAHRFNGSGASFYSYWLVDTVIKSSGLSPSLFSLMVFIHHFTNQGKKYINSSMVYNNSFLLPGVDIKAKRNYLSDLTRRGYLSRSYRDTHNPHYKISFQSRPVFIKLTSKGVQCIHNLEKDLYRILLNTSLNDLTGGNKKPR